MKENLRVGIVNFINTAPIYLPWKELGPLSGCEVVEGPPTLLNRMLEAGKLDVGLISSFSYGENLDQYYMIPDLGISATGPVGSVILFSRVDPTELDGKIIFLTTQSATSVNLLKIILEVFWSFTPVYRDGSFENFLSDESDNSGGYLAIGDEALRLSSAYPDLFKVDLAEIWLNKTHLPFVFAVWAVRKEAWEKKQDKIISLYNFLLKCYRQGKKRLRQISDKVAHVIPMSRDECYSYLKGIELDFSDSKEEGLRHFFRLLEKKGALSRSDPISYLPL